MTNTQAPPSAEQWAAFQAFQASEVTRKAAADAAVMTFPEVLHRLVARLEWRNEAERNSAHAALDKEFPPAVAATAPDAQTAAANAATANNPPLNTDGGIPAPVAQVPYAAAV